ncbi:hypothetical protein Mapa_013431 [Marchantia paleacea]|nr:hypothetical protein Mapa_013431 [Marchantia paleacea]
MGSSFASSSWWDGTTSFIYKLRSQIQSSESVDFVQAAAVFATVIISVISLGVAWAWMLGRKNPKRPPVPPGEYGLPFFGDTWKYVDAYYNNTLDQYVKEKAAKYGPIFKAKIMGQTTVFLDIPSGSKLLFTISNDEKLINGYWPQSTLRLVGPKVLSAENGVVYRAHRGHMLNNFSGIEIAHRHLPTIEQMAVKHMKDYWMKLEDGAEVASERGLQVFTFNVIADLSLSIEDESEANMLRAAIVTWAQGLVALPINLPGFTYYKAWEARRTILNILESHIHRRRSLLQKGGATQKQLQDYLSVQLTVPDDLGHTYTDAEIKDNILLLLHTGDNTLSSALSILFRLIAMNPAVYEKMIEEFSGIAANKKEGEALTIDDVRRMKYAWRVVQESLRLYPTLPGLYRQATTTFEYKGYTIPKGWKLYILSNHPQFFENADEFDPSRFDRSPPEPFTYFPYGGGVRTCPGKDMSKVSILVLLYHFMKNIKWEVVDPDDKIVYSFGPITTKGSEIRITKVKAF